MRRIPLRCALASLAAASLLAPSAWAATTYVAVPLTPLQAASATVAGINAAGQVAGTVRYGPVVFHGFIATGDITNDIGDLGGSPVAITGINDSGQLVGNVATSPQHALMFSKGVMTEVAIFGPSTTSSGAAINSAGDIVGTAQGRAYVSIKGEASDLGTLGGSTGVVDSQANGINAAGQVTGWARTGNGAMHAFLYDGHMHDLGTLGGPTSTGNALNGAGQIVGVSDIASGIHHAFLYSGGTMRDLGTLGGAQSVALGINGNADIVGVSDVPGSSVAHAFVVMAGVMQDLNGIVGGLNGAVLTAAVGINDNGQIAAQSCNSANVCQAYRLDPVSPKITAIEYYHAGFDHYFITANPDEIRKLDSGEIPGWVRTGATFEVRAGPNAGATNVCRFFSTAFGAKSSHFYTAIPTECEKVKQSPAWQFEGLAFNLALPDASGNCPVDYTTRVYRLYNDGQGGAPNHRFTTSPAIRDQMMAKGWIGEGTGEFGVGMCAP